MTRHQLDRRPRRPLGWPGAVRRWRLERALGRGRPRGPASSLSSYELRVCSQNGEDGVIHELFRRMGVRHRWFVEFGAGDGEEGCCVLLADRYRWSGLLIEAGPDAFRRLAHRYRGTREVKTVHALVRPGNIDGLLRQAGVPARIDLLSIDIDGNDYWVWQAIDATRARVVVVEYNGSLPLDRPLVMPPDDAHRWDGSDYFGASLAALVALGQKKGYELVHTDTTGVNAFFVAREELGALKGLEPDPPRPANYLGRGLRHPSDPLRRPYIDLRTG